MRGAVVVTTALTALLVLLGATVAGAGDTAQSLTLELSDASVQYGDPVVARGTIEPASAGVEVVLERDTGWSWVQVARTVTDPLGAFAVEFTAIAGGSLRVRETTSGATSEPAEISVVPRITLRTRRGLAFAGAKVSARVIPSVYAARATLTVKRKGEPVGQVRAIVRRGRLEALVPTPGVGRFTVVLSLPASSSLEATFATGAVAARGRVLAVGSHGADVQGLSKRLAELRFKVPAVSSTFSRELVDSVIAFQKAFGLPRTGVVGAVTWRALGRAHVVRPRYRGPSPHIEVDKTRQILLLVRGGTTQAVLPVSSGATGNTPEGKHHIRWKSPATTTWLGSGILYRTLTFYGNSFAIHGWPDVPAQPASHGCVRIPIWTADWLYNQSPVGETVYVYR